MSTLNVHRPFAPKPFRDVDPHDVERQQIHRSNRREAH
jgi:hypothetical protein